MAPTDIDALLDRHREKFRRLVQTMVAEEEGPDPFSYSLARYRALPREDRFELVRRAGLIARERVDEELRRRGAAWIVLVGDDVVAESPEVGSCPSADQVLALGEATDRVAFLFEASLIEELPSHAIWAALSPHDSYPTIPLSVEGDRMDADLDTGSHGTFFDARLIDEAVTWFEGRHLGQVFHWTPGRARVALQTGTARLERELAARFVRAWESSPFVRINARRKALAGRDLLRAFGLRIRLDAPRETTEIDSGV